MKLNKVHNDLKVLYKDKYTNPILGFEFDHEEEIERSMKILRSGGWSVAPFAFESFNNFAIKLTPEKDLFSSPIVAKNRADFWTISPSLKDFITMSWLRFLNDKNIITEINQNWKKLEELSLPFREYTHSLDSLEFFKTYLQEKLMPLEDPAQYYVSTHLDFWNHYYNNLGQKAYVELIQALTENRTYLPDFKTKDYALWTTKAYHNLTQRAYSYALLNLKEEQKGAFYWQSFIQPHGFDAASYEIEILPETSNKSEFQILATIGFADPGRIYEFSKEVQSHPLFSALEKIVKSSKSYNGDAHIEASKIIDTELGNPIMAWNALVSAGYWSGINFNEPNMEAWITAIALSEKHGWTEINEVLKDQLAFYNHYKD